MNSLDLLGLGRRVAQVLLVKINQIVFTSLVLGLTCDSKARTAFVSDGQHIGTSPSSQRITRAP
jgi:hypothetical protein